MGAMASQITSLTIVYSSVYSGAIREKASKLGVTGLCAGNSTTYDQNLASSEDGRDTSACKIACHFFQVFSKQCPETTNLTVSLSQNCANVRKIDKPWPNSNQFWRWPGYISMLNLRPLLPCVLRIMQETIFTRFTKSNCTKIRKIYRPSKIWKILKVVRIHEHAKFACALQIMHINLSDGWMDAQLDAQSVGRSPG